MELANKYNLVLYNDDINDMLYVMACLMKYCKHTNLQAEQCVVIADSKGTCIVKEGAWIDLFDINQELTSLGIKVELKEDESNLHKPQK
jgi:ATP-dependent Clp protease adaptor protein ClpS